MKQKRTEEQNDRAVANFLGSLEDTTDMDDMAKFHFRSNAYANLQADAIIYGWPASVVNKIRAGITKHFK